jgi:hypothetical protein
MRALIQSGMERVADGEVWVTEEGTVMTEIASRVLQAVREVSLRARPTELRPVRGLYLSKWAGHRSRCLKTWCRISPG